MAQHGCLETVWRQKLSHVEKIFHLLEVSEISFQHETTFVSRQPCYVIYYINTNKIPKHFTFDGQQIS